MNILSEPLVNYVLWENRDLQFIKKNCDSQFIQNRAALGYMLFITAYNSLKISLIS